MPRVDLTHDADNDLEKIFDYLAQFDTKNAAAKVLEIHRELNVLAQSPMIGRPLSSNIRELLIGKRPHGYTARYRYTSGSSVVLVLSIRSQRQR